MNRERNISRLGVHHNLIPSSLNSTLLFVFLYAALCRTFYNVCTSLTLPVEQKNHLFKTCHLFFYEVWVTILFYCFHCFMDSITFIHFNYHTFHYSIVNSDKFYFVGHKSLFSFPLLHSLDYFIHWLKYLEKPTSNSLMAFLFTLYVWSRFDYARVQCRTVPYSATDCCSDVGGVLLVETPPSA